MSWADDTTQLAADVIGALAETVTLRRQAAGAWSASTLARAVTETTYTLSGRVTRSRTTPVGEPGAPEQSVDVLIKTADLSVEPAAGDLLDRQRVGEQRLAEPAVLLRPTRAQPAIAAHLLEGHAVERSAALRALHLGDELGGHHLLEVRPQLVAQGALLGSPVEFHRAQRTSRRCAERHRRDRRDRAVTADDVVEAVYADVPREVWPAARMSIRAQLTYLGVSGRGA